MAKALAAKSAARGDKWEVRTDMAGQTNKNATLVDVDVNVNFAPKKLGSCIEVTLKETM
jgi:hypothetical protein